jgi:hypothetical protein
LKSRQNSAASKIRATTPQPCHAIFAIDPADDPAEAWRVGAKNLATTPSPTTRRLAMKITITIPLTVSADIAVTSDTNLDFLSQDIRYIVQWYMINWMLASNVDMDIPDLVTLFTNWDVGAFEIGIG